MKTIQIEEREVVPSKIDCIGRNYVAHIAELGNEVPAEMVVFLKPNSAISRNLRAVHQEQLHYEAEICFVVEHGRLAAVGCGLDLTKRELQSRLKSKGLPWERAKAFDGAALFSRFVPLPQESDELSLELSINGTLRQSGSTSLMIYPPQAILAELTTFMTLEDGDVLMTGTPAGVGEVLSGDLFEARIIAGGRELIGCRWQAI